MNRLMRWASPPEHQRGGRRSRIASGLVVGRSFSCGALDESPDNQICGDPWPAHRAERAKGLRGAGSRLLKMLSMNVRAGSHPRSLRNPRPLTLMLRR